jgi:DNA-binding transcriptional ArsR family regulator
MSKPTRLSLDVISWLDCIWKTELPSASKLVAAYLRSYMNSKHDMAWPSLSRIVKETGLGQSTVCKHLEVLESSGWIKRNRGHGGSVTKSTEYIACFPVSWEKAIAQIEVNNGLPSPPGGEAPLHTIESPSPPNGVAPLHQTDTNIQVLNKQTNNQDSVTGKPMTCPHEEIINIYHELLPTGTRVKLWTDARKRLLQTRWKGDIRRQNLDWWRKFFSYCAESPFLTSQVPPTNGYRQFVVNLEWILTSSHFTDIVEGKYHEDSAA